MPCTFLFTIFMYNPILADSAKKRQTFLQLKISRLAEQIKLVLIPSVLYCSIKIPAEFQRQQS